MTTSPSNDFVPLRQLADNLDGVTGEMVRESNPLQFEKGDRVIVSPNDGHGDMKGRVLSVSVIAVKVVAVDADGYPMDRYYAHSQVRRA